MPLDFPTLPQWLQPGNDIYNARQTSDDFGRNFMSAYQQAHEEKVQAPMRELAVKQAQANLDISNFTIQRNQDMLETATQTKAGEAAMAGVLSDIAKTGDWTNPAARSKVFEVGAKFPSIVGSKVWQDTQLNFAKADKTSQEAERYKLQAQEAEARNKSLEERAKIAAESRKDVAGLAAEGRMGVANIQAASREKTANIRKDATLEAVQMRLKDSQSKASSLLGQAKLADYKARQHTIWNDFTLDPDAKQKALDALDAKFGVEGKFDAEPAKPDAKSDPLGLFK